MTRRLAMLCVAVVAGALIVGGWQERTAARAEIARLERVSSGARVGPVDLSGLPAPVARYLRLALADTRRFNWIRLRQRGELRTSTRASRWLPFDAEQVIRSGVGFVWSARVSLAPLLHLRVRDALIEGEGSGRVTLWSVLPLASQAQTPEVTSGSLHRYLAEGVWCPATLLPSAALVWTPIDETRATATLSDHGVTVSLEFRFAPGGEVLGIYTPRRWGAFDEGYRQVPWEGHFRNYRQRSGLLVPMEADVGWYVDGEWQPVWKGQIERFEAEAPAG